MEIPTRRVPVLVASCVLTAVVLTTVSFVVDAVKFAPNHFLGTCLTPQWVHDIEAKLKVSSTARDDQLRLLEPHLHAALPSRRFAVRDPRTSVARDQLFTPTCTKTPFRFWGVGANADPATGDPSTDGGSVNGSLVIELKGWASSQLTTLVFAILAQAVLGYNVSIYRSTNAVDMGARMASTREGFCTPLHINVEEWGRDHTAYANESFKAGTQSYVGRSGLYTTTKFVEAGLDAAQYTPTFSADFWRDYATNDKLIAALDIATFKANTKYYPPPAPAICADGFRGCKDACSKTDTCTAREKLGKPCLVVQMMFPTYDDGWAESALANNKVPSYHCFLGDTAIEQFAVEMERANKPILFFHYEPDPFHYVHYGKFRRVFLPRTLPELVKLNKADFGENGYGAKTDNPLSVDFLPTTLSIYAASLIQDHAPIAALLSRFTLAEMDMGTLLQSLVDLEAYTVEGIAPDDTVFSAACAWVRDNYPVWKRWLARLPVCDLDLHMAYTFHHCDDAQPREIRWAWNEPHPLDVATPYVCDGGRSMLPKTITTSKSCAWLAANKLVWQAWTVVLPVCDPQFYTFRVSSCDARAKREATYAWLLPDPSDPTKSLECRIDNGGGGGGGVSLPKPVELACEYTPFASPIA